MSVSLRVLDDGAWVSVNDQRQVAVSELWRLADGFCDCDVPDVVVEGFLDVAADGRTVTARVYGRCIVCGASGTTGWLPVGRVRDGTFRELADGAVRAGKKRRESPLSGSTGKG